MVPIEIERKFVADRVPDAVDGVTGTRMRQGYVAEQRDVSVRVRITEDRAWLAVKAGRGTARTEVETTIPRDDAEELWSLTEGRRLAKTRYLLPLPDDQDLVAEVDVFDEQLAGLCIIEVEFDSLTAADRFEAPAWFGREVTGEPGWSNAALATNGIPGGW